MFNKRKIVKVKPCADDYTVAVYYSDGMVTLFSLKPFLDTKPFTRLKDKGIFLNHCTILNGTLAWDMIGDMDESACIDIDPRTLLACPKVITEDALIVPKHKAPLPMYEMLKLECMGYMLTDDLAIKGVLKDNGLNIHVVDTKNAYAMAELLSDTPVSICRPQKNTFIYDDARCYQMFYHVERLKNRLWLAQILKNTTDIEGEIIEDNKEAEDVLKKTIYPQNADELKKILNDIEVDKGTDVARERVH